MSLLLMGTGRGGTSGPPPSGLLAETDAFIARIVADGAAMPSAEDKTLLDDLYTDLKSGPISGSDILAKLDVLVVPQRQAVSWQNLVADSKNPTIGGGAPVFQDGGYFTDGVDDSINTNFNPATAAGLYSQNSACFGILSRTDEQSPGGVAGAQNINGGITVKPRGTADSINFRINQVANSGSAGGSVTSGIGFYVANRSGASATQLYRNGVAVSVTSSPNQASVALLNLNLFLGFVDGSFFTLDFGGYVIGQSLTANEQADLSNAVNAYSAAISGAPPPPPPPPPPPGTVDYFAANGAASMFNSFNGPTSIYIPALNQTWVSWEAGLGGEVRRPWVRTFDHDTLIWTDPIQVGSAGLIDDAHGTPVLKLGPDNHVYCFWGAHGSPLRISSTNNPLDPSAWTTRTSLSDLTYPHVFVHGGKLYVSHREGEGIQGPRYWGMVSATCSNGVPTWGSLTRLVDYYPGATPGQVMNYRRESRLIGDNLWTMGWQSGDVNSEQYNVYFYVYNLATGVLRNVQNTVTKSSGFPLTMAEANANFRAMIAHTVGSQTARCFCHDTAGNLHWWARDEATYYYGIMPAGHTGAWPAPTVWTGITPKAAYPLADGRIQLIGAAFTSTRLIQVQTRSLAGTWGSAATIFTLDPARWTLGGENIMPEAWYVQTPNHANARVVIGEVINQAQNPPQTEVDVLRGWLWGDGGFVRA